MNIVEAMNARTPNQIYIMRKAWDYPTEGGRNPEAAVKLLPTDSPNGCLICGVDEKIPRGRWQPTAGDLVADDWITVC